MKTQAPCGLRAGSSPVLLVMIEAGYFCIRLFGGVQASGKFVIELFFYHICPV
jgi:hypothetical protein